MMKMTGLNKPFNSTAEDQMLTLALNGIEHKNQLKYERATMHVLVDHTKAMA